MSELMSRDFITAFITECFDAGLSEKAASELLQKESLDQVMQDNPGFAEGYIKEAAAFPGQLRPILFSKEASPIAALARGAGGILGSAMRKKPLLTAAVGVPTATVGALKGGEAYGGAMQAIIDRLLNPEKRSQQPQPAPQPAAPGVKKEAADIEKSAMPLLRGFGRVAKRFPKSTAVGTAGLAGGAVHGYNQLTTPENFNAWGNSPHLSPSGYSPEAYAAWQKSEMSRHKPGIWENNKKFFGTEGRRNELRKAIAEGRGGSGAYHELQKLESEHAATRSQRDNYFSELDKGQAHNQDLLGRISRRQSTLRDRATSWSGLPQRLWLRATGRDPQEHFDNEISSLYDNAQQAQMGINTANRRRELLFGGATGEKKDTQKTHKELQDRFFPAYNQ